MNRIQATIKIPQSHVESISTQLRSLGVTEIIIQQVPYETFTKQSRMNYDCVFEQMWTDRVDVAYLNLFFEDTAEGREAAFHVEFNLKQIPLNLCYMTI